jgi:hypothetical protein
MKFINTYIIIHYIEYKGNFSNQGTKYVTITIH